MTRPGGQTEEECSVSALSAAAAEQMDMFGKGLYLEPACVDGTQPLPMHCNYMGIGQECRGCFMTCDGATSYIENFADEIAVWVRTSKLCSLEQWSLSALPVIASEKHRAL